MSVLTLFIDDIRNRIARQQCAIIVGAGVTMGAVPNLNKDCSWKGLLKSGLERCKSFNSNLSDEWLKRKKEDLETGDIYTLLTIAFEVENRLKDNHANVFADWLESEIGKLKPYKRDVLEAIANLGNVIATTNYDGFLLEVTQLDPITWLKPRDVHQILIGDKRGIIHLHGYWKDPNSVILGGNSYSHILSNKEAQAMQQLLAASYQMLFVGYGAGLDDPNFKSLLNWLGTALKESPIQHFLLLREKDIGTVNGKILKEANVQLLPYGKEFEDLAPFLQSLAPINKQIIVSVPPFSGELPQPMNFPIGRQKEIKRVKDLIKDPSVRLVTLHGASGIGKTLLAIQAANELKKERKFDIRFIPLASIGDSNLVPTEIAPAVGFPESKSFEHLLNYLKDKKYLLLIDNFEQVINASEQIKSLIEKCPKLKFLITSQLPLSITGEHVEEVEPLKQPESTYNLPATDVLINKYPSIELFVERAQQASSNFKLGNSDTKSVAEICALVDGLPLAIEIIAAYTSSYKPRQILQEIKKGGYLNFSKSSPGDTATRRHETLQDALSWSFNLLNDDEKNLFCILSVFEGGFSVANAQKICEKAGYSSLDVFEGFRSLKDRSLLRVQEQSYLDGENRFTMLEPIRAFGLNQLEELETIRFHHANFFLEFVEESESKLTSQERGAGKWLNRLDTEYENLRAVLEWCKGNPKNGCEIGLRLASSLFWYWNLRGRLSEGLKWLEELYEKTETVEAGTKAKALYGLGGLAFLQGKYTQAYERLNESIKIWREIIEKKPRDKRNLGYALIILGMVELNHSPENLGQARIHLEESVKIFNEINDDWGLALSHNDLGRIATAEKKYPEGQDLYEKSLKLWEEMDDHWGKPLTLNCLGELMRLKGNYKDALTYLKEGLNIQREQDKWGRALTFKELGKVYFEMGDYKSAAGNFYISLKMHNELNRRQLIAECLEGIAMLLIVYNNFYDARLLFSAARKLRDEIEARMSDSEQEKYDRYIEEIFACQMISTDEIKQADEKGKNKKTGDIIKQALQICRKIMSIGQPIN